LAQGAKTLHCHTHSIDLSSSAAQHVDFRKMASRRLRPAAALSQAQKENAVAKSMAKPTETPSLELQEGLDALDEIIESVSKREFQEELAALHATKPWRSFQEMFKMRRELTNSLAIPIIAQYGFEASDDGVNTFMRAFLKAPFKGTPQAQEKHTALRVLMNLDEEAVGAFDGLAPKFGRNWVITEKCPNAGLPVKESWHATGKKMSTQLLADAVLQEFGQESGYLRFRKLKGSGPKFGWVQIRAGIVEPRDGVNNK